MATVKTLFFNGIGIAGSIDIPASGWTTQPDYCIFEWQGNPSELESPGYNVIRCIKIKQDVKHFIHPRTFLYASFLSIPLQIPREHVLISISVVCLL